MFGTDHNPAFSLPLTMTARRVRRRARGGLLRHAVESGGAALMQIARAITDRLEIRQQMHALASLDDHMLKDIGVVRGEIPFRVRAARRSATRID
jgi:uncharacterized protein YjiS (DUF1127 family)